MTEVKLIQLLNRKRGFFEAILDLTLVEAELSVKEWISVLEQKKILLSCIDEIDHELAPYKDRLSNLSQEALEELEAIRKVVEKILKLDLENQKARKSQLLPERVKRY